ncbi:hypothetical protein LX69_02910 [Breznakibacter xylanolyticus]|uniref:Uncharacterized protein n=1 Tax=Breznakibacter xylanolyticus TaxID=990 RepID=A0A2W7PSA6_9BACT|nr:hypothetical protein [Breznakibacter xylanolyticus]PZX12319.1 hypothetical protein LX69_02910 [Breznakibacter xylanolyticus]
MIASFEIFALLLFLLLTVGILLIVHWFLKYFMLQQRTALMKDDRKHLLNLRLQAYERLTLFLERMHPESLVIREQQSGLVTHQFHNVLLKSIRSEFEHNLAMQLYVAGDTWEQVKEAREEVVKLINTSAAQVAPNAPSVELGRVIIEQGGGATLRSLKKAIDKVKSDVALLG